MLDNFRETAITWDKASRKVYEPLRASAGDNKGRKLSVQIVNDGAIEDLSGASLSLFWETKDKAHKGLDVFTEVDATKGEFEIYYTTGMLSNEGTLNANLVLVDTSGRIVSEPFTITVFKGIDDDAIQSENSFTTLTQALIDISDLEKNYAPRLTELTGLVQQTKEDVDTKISYQEVLNHLEKYVLKNGNMEVTYNNLSQEIRELFTGGNTAVVGVDSVGTDNIVDNSINFAKLMDNFMYDSTLNAIPAGANLNSYLKTGIYLTTGITINIPVGASSTAVMFVASANNNYGFQLYIGTNNRAFWRLNAANTPTGFREWREISNNADLTALFDKVSINRYPHLTETDDLNDLITDGKWVAVNSNNTPIGRNLTWNVKVETYRTTEGSETRWGTQTATPIQSSDNVVYLRRFRVTIESGSPKTEFFEWMRLDNATVTIASHLVGQTIVNFGDSIFGNVDDETSVSAYIAERTGATVLNIGFGGSRVAEHSPYWDAFSWYRLVDEIVKPNSDGTKWKLQDEAITAMKSGEPLGMPAYFEQRLERLKAIDFSKKDTIVTFAAGTNDFASNRVDVENALNLEDTKTYGGALRYGLRKLFETYPHIKVLLCTPIYRFWIVDGVVTEDSDVRVVKNQKLTDFVDKTIEIGHEFKLPVLDNYYNLGINKYNKYQYFPTTDGTHPNANGRELMGNKIGSALIDNY